MMMSRSNLPISCLITVGKTTSVQEAEEECIIDKLLRDIRKGTPLKRRSTRKSSSFQNDSSSSAADPDN